MSPDRICFVFALLLLMILSQNSGGLMAEWCIANEQTPDSKLQAGLDWACGIGGADCTKILPGHACYPPNTVRAHASYAFNNYYQKYKHRGATCFFQGAAIITLLDPSHDTCHYELTP
ncbi:hypothetical protein CASFOL_022416 [Castilleja foliolosa]|uniref:X8 domain-containing protein n=1 Tax=Castilleja foliolosa TaxID=1961234 RepID=A0ABD3CX06_9LAMI